MTNAAGHLSNAWGCIRVDVTQDGLGQPYLRGLVSDPLAKPWQVTPDGRALAGWQLHVGVEEQSNPLGGVAYQGRTPALRPSRRSEAEGHRKGCTGVEPLTERQFRRPPAGCAQRSIRRFARRPSLPGARQSDDLDHRMRAGRSSQHGNWSGRA